MKIHILAFGKLKRPGFRESANYYKKLASNWTTVSEIELKPSSLTSKKEAQKKDMELLINTIQKKFPLKRKVFFLDEKGKSQNSLEWAETLQQERRESVPDILFCLGSSHGLMESHLKKELKNITPLSLGPQTLSHELARVVLLEQIYRAFSIIHHHPYHHE